MNRDGHHIGNFNLAAADARLCQMSCIENHQCTAWVYRKPEGRTDHNPHCWLLDKTDPTTRKSVTIIDNAMETTPNGIFVIGTRDGKPAQGIWRLEKDRMVQQESALAGQQEISAGKWVRTGMDMPWLYRCGAPGQQSNTTASTPFVVPDPNGGA